MTLSYDADDTWGLGSAKGTYQQCYKTHQPLPVVHQGKTFHVYGGSCSNPVHLDCDVYVALQAGSRVRLAQPWEAGYGQIIQVDFDIRDMHAPGDAHEFGQMIDWLCTQVQSGKRVHVGCIGGHGRTGTVLSALVAKLMPEEPDAIGYVRKHYCKKAVESKSQVQFLHKHYGCKVVTGYKEGLFKAADDLALWGAHSPGPAGKNWPKSGASEFAPVKGTRFAGAKRTVEPVPSKRNIFVSHA